jgi:uncharacterized protein YodC (DUF2158 family)
MADDIKPGSVVVLKSGGPNMTVYKVEQFNGVMTAWCDWFEDNKTARNIFPLSSLKLLE